MPWYKWVLYSGVLTLIYLPITLNERDMLFKSPVMIEDCKSDDYCKQNLIFFPIRFIAAHGDLSSYLRPIDYFFNQGIYWDDYRMPGYGVFYGIFLLLTGGNKTGALWLLFLLQFISWGIAIGLTANELQKRSVRSSIIWLFVLLTTFSPLSYYVRVLGTESLTASLGLLGVISIINGKHLMGGGLLTWCFFMRPAHALWVAVGGIATWLSSDKKVRALLLFSIPFLLAEGAWVLRNYYFYGDFRPLSGSNTTLYPAIYSTYQYEALELMKLSGITDFRRLIEGNNVASLLYCHDFKPPPVEKVRAMLPPSFFSEQCSPESLYVAGILACELAHSPTYSPTPPESLYYSLQPKFRYDHIMALHPTKSDCEKEHRLSKIIIICIQNGEKNMKKAPLRRIANYLKRVFEVPELVSNYDKSSSKKRLIIKRTYSKVYKLIYTLSIALAIFYIFLGNTFQRVIAMCIISIIMFYALLNYSERRYLETLSPFKLCLLTYVLNDTINRLALFRLR
ncbi:MAG: hypothetical protein RMJ66_02235 [Bacteroidia bacterium]|nr:hypothetical protein [Bacteroidia bacterium]MDW8133864.1 hypothetical protein [Bacteroidia bacterium]